MFSHIKELFTRPSGYSISRSVRLRSSASAYLSRTPASASNRKTWTWSGWVKRGILGSTDRLFCAGSGSTYTEILTVSDTIKLNGQIAGADNGQVNTVAVFRDPSAWYHIVVAFDVTASTKIIVYINGVSQTLTTTTAFTNQNYEINNTVSHNVGNFAPTPTSGDAWDGYLTEINFIDGQALTPSSFGSTNAITGVWQPAKYTGTYGTNGFYLNFSDNSSNTATTIGKDYSGNGNNWTPNNISVTSGATYDSMLDVPTPYADGGNGRGNYCVMNPLVPDTANSAATRTFADGNLKVTTTTTAGGQSDVYGSIGVTSGKWYYEGVRTGGTVDAFFGWSSARFQNYTAYYGGNGNKYTQSGSSAYGASWTTNDVIGIAYDADNNTITFYKNGTSQGAITSALDPTQAPFFPIAFDGSGSLYADLVFNFGQRPFTYTPPSGFVALNTQNLPDSTIKNGAAYMAATLYTGTGSSQTVANTVNSVNFKPDLVWIKSRSAATDHKLTDSVRGATKALISDTTGAETTDTNGLTAFGTSGFTVGSDSVYNNNTATYVGWQWQAGQGTTSSNTNGSITSNVSVSTTAGFSVVKYSQGATNGTVGHGLGVAPSFIICRSIDNAGTSWITYQSVLGKDAILRLNTTDAYSTVSNIWGTANPTSTVFGVGTAGSNSNNLGNVIAYCWAEIAGFSKFGSYTGNGSTDGPFVYLGFRPKWVMIKNSTTGGTSWVVLDTSRNTYNVENSILLPNDTGAEDSSSNRIDGLSNGFKLRLSGSWGNASGDTYIYAAFAENPFKNALAR